ncbi:hypothetical protein Pmani_018752 [Petrolisthes manimaculis]|uniref:C2H2-type domain-containing protein n=2 Tax=Petrolisthes TaxID=84661 RepID=A0AAE1PKZ6_9EUCA|nr:hypothetical protein Pcinc_014493 [Petrolisthes cinctipes]KAK4309641.1 hypothetical protein Pmani_018752 [Petrolisthes manimaculis]
MHNDKKLLRQRFAVLQAVRGAVSEGLFVQCPACGKKCFGRNRKQNMVHHMATHSRERPVTCPHCPYRAASESQLFRHITMLHLKYSSFSLPTQNTPNTS